MLIQSLLDESEELRRLCGTNPDDFITRVRQEVVREAIYQLFPAERRVHPQPRLIAFPSIGH
jgi:hypothetical protein